MNRNNNKLKIVETKRNFKLIGLKLSHKTTNENGQSGNDCGSLWQKFEREKVANLIPEKISDDVYAVYFDFEKDETGPFSYFIGCRVALNAGTPENLDELVIPVQDYQKVTSKGVMPGCIAETWKEIWNSSIKRNFGFDFEVYDKRSLDWDNAEVDIYISITG